MFTGNETSFYWVSEGVVHEKRLRNGVLEKAEMPVMHL